MDLETSIKAALERRAGTPDIPPMPPRTMSKIRVRQGLTIGVAGGVAMCLIAAIFVIFRFAPVHDAVHAAHDGPTSPLEEVPEGWPDVDILDPESAYHPDPVEFAAVDRVGVIATGSVAGHGFSFVGWTGSTEPDEAVGPCFLFAGPGAPPSPKSFNGQGGPVVSTCAQFQDPPLPEGADLYLLGQQSADVAGIGANMGFVSSRVRSLRIVLDEGGDITISLLRGPQGWRGVRTFLFFAPAAGGGNLIARDEDGTVLAMAPICVFEEGFSGACGGPARQLEALPAR